MKETGNRGNSEKENSQKPTEKDPGQSAFASHASGLLRKALPLYFSMVSSLSGTLVTAGVLGNTRTEVLAAHALVSALLAPTIMVVQGTLRGSMPFVAENEDDPPALARVARDGICLAMLMGVVAGAFVSATPVLAGAAGVPEDTRSALGLYPLLLGVYAVMASLSTAATVLLTALGKNRLVLTRSLMSTALTLVLVPCLVLGLGPVPAMGLVGAGIAMILASTVTLVLTWWAVHNALPGLSGLLFRSGKPSRAGVSDILKVGFPTGSTLLVKSVSLSVLTVVVARVGAEDAAAHQFLVLFANLLFFPSLAIGQSAVPFIAKAAKAGDRHGVRDTALAGYTISVPVTLVSAAALWTLISPVTGLLTHDPEVRSLVASLLPLLFLMTLFDGLQVVSGMGLAALKRTTPAMYTFVVCYGLLMLLSVPLSVTGGLHALWAAYAVATLGLLVGQAGAFARMSARV